MLECFCCQPSERALCIHISPLFWIFFHVGPYKALSRVPRAVEQVLSNYLTLAFLQKKKAEVMDSIMSGRV